MTRERTDGDWLDAALAAHGADHRDAHIDDGGFSLRVMEALPPAVALPAWRRSALALLWAAAGLGVAFVLPGAFTEVVREAFRLLGGHAVSLSGLATAIAAGAALTWGAAAYVMRSD